jgi:hypothetical protein
MLAKTACIRVNHLQRRLTPPLPESNAKRGEGRQAFLRSDYLWLDYITGMVKLAPSLTPEGQRAVTVLVLV